MVEHEIGACHECYGTGRGLINTGVPCFRCRGSGRLYYIPPADQHHGDLLDEAPGQEQIGISTMPAP